MAAGLWACLAAPPALIITWLVYDFTAVGNWIDLILAGRPAEPELVYELADLFDLTVLDSMEGEM